MTHSAHDSGHGHDAGAHGSHSNAKYVAVFLALCVLTSMSFMTFAEWWPFDAVVNRLFMMAVSCAKAGLVMAVFMHLWWEADWKWVLTIPASMMSIFLMLALVPDVGFRTRSYSEDRKSHAPDNEDRAAVVNVSKEAAAAGKH